MKSTTHPIRMSPKTWDKFKKLKLRSGKNWDKFISDIISLNK